MPISFDLGGDFVFSIVGGEYSTEPPSDTT